MPAQVNHMIVWCHDKMSSSSFLADILGRPAPKPFYEFMRVDFDNTVGLQFLEKEGKIEMQHYAFLIAESDFDAFFARPFLTGPILRGRSPMRSTTITAVEASILKIQTVTISK